MSKNYEEETKVVVKGGSDAFVDRLKENLADFARPDVVQMLIMGEDENGKKRSAFDIHRYNQEIRIYREDLKGKKKKGKKGKKGKKKYIDYRKKSKYHW